MAELATVRALRTARNGGMTLNLGRSKLSGAGGRRVSGYCGTWLDGGLGSVIGG